MDARTIRSVIIEGLETGAVWEASRIDFREAFLDGDARPSRSRSSRWTASRSMELCIAIEIGTGVSLAPEELDRYARSRRWSTRSRAGSVLDDYLAQLARCATGNQLNRLHITLENVLAPAEMCALIDGVRARTSRCRPSRSRTGSIALDAHPAGNGGRRVQGVRSPRARGGRDRLLGAGRRGRARAAHARDRVHRRREPADDADRAVPAALSRPTRYEFVVLVDPRRTVLPVGRPGARARPARDDRAARRAVRPSTFRRAVALGTSAGGLAAVWTGVALGLERAVSVGGVTPSEVADRSQTRGAGSRGDSTRRSGRAARAAGGRCSSRRQRERDHRRR